MKGLIKLPLIIIMLIILPLNASSKVHLVAVGITDYPGSRNDLNLPAKDAITIKNLIDMNSNAASILLTDDNATKNNILNSIHELFLHASTDDIVIVFFSGHGYKGGFVAYDEYLSYDELRKAMSVTHCKNKMIFADACFSGKMRQGKKPPTIESQNSNVMLFLSSRDNEVSIERKSMENGFFTTCLRDALRGKADANRNRIITAKELFKYVSKNVKLLSKDKQHPVMWGNFDNEMPVIKW